MATRQPRSTEFGTASILAVAIFLMAWNVVERVTGTGPKAGALPGTTYQAAAQAGATVTPSEQPSVLSQ
jgi:hypothetical protein